MVGAFDFRLSGPDSSAGQARSLCCVLGRDSDSDSASPPRSINGYRRHNAGSSNTPRRLHATEIGISSSHVGQFGLSATLPYIQ